MRLRLKESRARLAILRGDKTLRDQNARSIFGRISSMAGRHSQAARLLVISTNEWPSVGKLASALVVAGFHVAVLCPAGNPVNRITKIHGRFRYRSWNSATSIRLAIKEWSPDVLVCTDDLAVRKLHSLYFEASKKIEERDSQYLMSLIESSLGDHRYFVKTQLKSEILLLAASIGTLCPRTAIWANNITLEREADRTLFPILVKTDGSFGGRGVRLVKDQRGLLAAIIELHLPYSWPGPLKRLLGRHFFNLFFRWSSEWPRKISIQQYIDGRPCNRAVVCWKGKVLAGITADVLATSYLFGPATVVKIIDHPNITSAVEAIVAKLKLSGFVGFDFMLDSKNNAWFLEMNLRATPTSHICAQGQDLAASFFSQIAGTTPKASNRVIHGNVVRLFPVEVTEPEKVKVSMFDDAPDDEADYVDACRSKKNKKGSLRYVLQKLCIR